VIFSFLHNAVENVWQITKFAKEKGKKEKRKKKKNDK